MSPTEITARLEEAERLLRARKLEQSGKAALIVFSDYKEQKLPSTPRMVRLLSVFIAASNSDWSLLPLLDQPTSAQ